MSETPVEIKFLQGHEREDWDEYVNQHSQHSPYHLFAWLQAIEMAYHHKIGYLVAMKDKKIVGVLPFAVISIPFIGSTIHSLPFCDLGGALADNEKTKKMLEMSVFEKQSQLKVKSVEFRECDLQQVATELDLTNKKVSMLLPLAETSEELMASFKSKLRSQIRKAEKNGLVYELGCSRELIDEFYQVISENMHRLGSPVHSYLWFEAICQHYGKNCMIAIVRYEGVAVGAGLILLTESKVCIPWASTRFEYNKLSPNMLLYWALLKFSNDQGCSQFDFGRSTYNEGTFKFKRQWGAKPVPLKWRHSDDEVNSEKVPSADSNKLRTTIENVWRKLPLSVVNFIGPKLRKYISL